MNTLQPDHTPETVEQLRAENCRLKRMLHVRVLQEIVGNSTVIQTLRHELQAAAEHAVERPATIADTIIDTATWVTAPTPKRVRDMPPEYAPRFSPARRDYLTRESRNRSLGRAGELFVMELEAQRLHTLGRKALADRIEHVAQTQGDGLGFDVLSFEADGRERLIEVKTTAFGELTPFFVSRNELARSTTDAECYQLYRVFDFRKRPKVFNLQGAISTHCQLDPTTFLARLAG
jgi:hypothetical protein